MSVDIEALYRAASGDPDGKVAVKKRWLAEVHRELVELRRMRATAKLGDGLGAIGEKLMGMAHGYRG